MIGSIFDQTSNDMFLQRENEALREASLRLEEAQHDANHRLEEAQRAAADLEVLYMEWACVHIEIRLVIHLPPHVAGPAVEREGGDATPPNPTTGAKMQQFCTFLHTLFSGIRCISPCLLFIGDAQCEVVRRPQVIGRRDGEVSFPPR